MPRIREEDRQFAERLAGVLRELRAVSGWTQEQAAEAIGVPIGKIGRWERADFAPKGYDLGRIYRAYERFGADWRWFFDPPEIVVLNPVRTRLDELTAAGTIEGAAAGRKAAARAQRAASPRGGGRERRTA